MATKFRMMQQQDASMESEPLKVTHFYMLKNGWEVYEILPEEDGKEIKNPPGLVFTLTVGDFTEFGFHEEKALIQNSWVNTDDLHEVMPPPKWEWVGVH